MRRWKKFAWAIPFSAVLSIAWTVTEHTPAAATSCASLVGLPIIEGTITSAADITSPFTTTASSGAGDHRRVGAVPVLQGHRGPDTDLGLARRHGTVDA